MSERSYEEYWKYLENRNHWSLQCDLYSAQISELQEKIEKLTKAGQQITLSAGDIRGLMARLSDLPAAYPQWSGYAADRYFGQCAAGDLYTAYQDYSMRLDTVRHFVETARDRLSAQLEMVNSSYLEALGNYVCWNNRTAYYWN